MADPQQMVTMLAPDGTSGDIPADRVAAATQAGFRQAVSMTSPDGTQGYIPIDRRDDAVKAGFKLTPQTPAQPAPEGFFHSLASQFGLTPDQIQQGAADEDAHPVKTVLKSLLGPGGSVLEGLYNQGKASLSDIKDAVHAAAGGNTAQAGVDAVHAVPIVGPGLVKAAQQAPASTGSYTRDIANAATDPSAMGTVTGSSAQAALLATEPLSRAAEATGVTGAVKAVAGRLSPEAMRTQAGQLLQSVAGDANKIPVQLDNAQPAALRLMDWQGKTQLGPTINKFLNRITKPNSAPLTYAEGRDYYQLLGRLSADEASKLPPAVQRDLAQMVNGFKTDLGNAADVAGRGVDYYKGLKDYSTAMRLQGWYDFAKKTLAPIVVKGAAGAVGAGAAGSIGYHIYKESQQ